MSRTSLRVVAAGIAAGIAFSATPQDAEAQATFTACRVPDVGAIYMIGVAGAPSACLDVSHVEFSWTEGGASVADGSITTVKLADGAVTSAKIADGTIIGADMVGGTVGTAELALNAVTSAQLATDAVTSAAIAPDAVGSTEVLDESLTAADLAADAVGTSEIVDGAVTLAKLDGGVNLGFTTITRRSTSPGEPLPAFASTFVSIACLVGETVTGGGGVNQNGPGIFLKQSYPTGSSWSVTYENTTGSAGTGYAYAMCAS